MIRDTDISDSESITKIKGFAYINNCRGRSAYDITLETSIYIDRECTGEGIGRKLYDHLILESKKIGINSLIVVISLPNEASQKLHRHFDFNLVGVSGRQEKSSINYEAAACI
ncbi:uncharacterized protein PRCAT00005900001 [Priceomyces carsonii]|uniref:uncharacterized protein n=1 Tax=Priceomyces carsonii TaxID=28549 RepID=UPI002EDB3313|nr:unnamed protein product [Priceomyces carsonii]